MKPLDPSDPEYFTHYCEKSYDRHSYKIHFKNGKSVKVEDYETVKSLWWQWKDNVESVEVIDSSGQGF